jgi:ribosomal-protein-alanine N-acetyltransferase
MDALSTSRLVFIELALDDAVDLFAVRGDPVAMAYWDWPADPNPGVTRALVTGMLQEASAGRAKYWTLRLRSDRTFVGLCDLSELRPGKPADLGFMVVRQHWGQGLAQEAVTAVVGYAREFGLTSVHARVHKDNERSVRLLERTGFVETQLIRHFEIRPGVFRDCRSFTIVL